MQRLALGRIVVNNPLSRLPRLADWYLATALLSLAVLLLAPQQLPVSLYKLSLVALAAVAGYWLDRSLFPYARPDHMMAQWAAEPGRGWQWVFAASMLRRAVIVAAAMLAIGLGA